MQSRFNIALLWAVLLFKEVFHDGVTLLLQNILDAFYGLMAGQNWLNLFNPLLLVS